MFGLPLTFATPLLLIGLLAAAIPFVLHLLSSVRAPEMYFPTLRFLRISMEKTARRRRLEHWLLLLIRSLLMALLAVAVAQPILKTTAGFWSNRPYAAVLVVDNSYSMAVRSGGMSRFDHARREAGELLGGSAKPTVAAVLLTNGGGDETLHADLDQPRDRLARAALASGRAPLVERILRAADLLADSTVAQKAIYVFTDGQRINFDDLGRLARLNDRGIPILLVDCAGETPVNVGLTDLKVDGRLLVDQGMLVTARLLNASPTDRTVDVYLEIDGRQVVESVAKGLKQAGRQGDRSDIRFTHRFTTPGVHTGQVVIATDDSLNVDNARRFVRNVAGKARVLLVRPEPAPPGAFDPAVTLRLALDPFVGAAAPWSVDLKTVDLGELSAASLAGADAVFLADVPSVTPAQAGELVAFARRGGSVVFFLGPGTDVDAFNRLFVQQVPDFGGLLPGRLAAAVGSVGLTADAVVAVKDLQHPYLADLYKTPADYPEVLVQRHYRLTGIGGDVEKIVSTPGGEPIVAAKDFGAGRVVLFATTASAEWNNLPTTALLLPMVTRIALEAGERTGGDLTFPAGGVVVLPATAAMTDGAAVSFSGPDQQVVLGRLRSAGGGFTLMAPPKDAPAAGPSDLVPFVSERPGLFNWQLVAAGPADVGARGAFAVNIYGVESDLASASVAAIADAVRPTDLFAGKTLREVHQAAAEAGEGEDLWPPFLAVVILLLVVEANVANRFRRGAEPIPPELNPRLAARTQTKVPVASRG